MPRTRADARADARPARARAPRARLRRRLGDRRPRGGDRDRARRGHARRLHHGAQRGGPREAEQRFAGNERVRVLGFTEQMSDWMAAADAMVHSTAGLTVLEAHIRGCPVVSYGFSAGHLRANNAAFERFGLAEVARSEHELESMLRHLTSERRPPDPTFASLPSIASRVLAARPRVRPQPVWRLRLERVATAVSSRSGAVVMLLTVIDRETPYKVVAKPLEGRIHFGKDEDARTAAEGSTAGLRAQRGRRMADRRGLGAGLPPLGYSAVRRWPPSCRGSGRLGIVSAGGRRGRGSDLRRRPPSAGDAAGARDAARGRRGGDLLPGRRAGRAPPGAGGRDRRRRAPGRAALPPAPQPSAARAASVPRGRRTGPGGDRGASGRRSPTTGRPTASSARRPCGDSAAGLAAGALVAVGKGLDRRATARSIARRATARSAAGTSSSCTTPTTTAPPVPGRAPPRPCRSSSRSSRGGG